MYKKHVIAALVLLSASFAGVAQEVAQSAPSPEQSDRFVLREGTGDSRPVSRAPVPQVDPERVRRAVQEAAESAGRPVDPITRDINLPGLKPDSPTLLPWVLHTRNGVNEIIHLSESFINRIATPFSKPVLVDQSDSNFQIIGSDIFYMPAGDEPAGVFIIDGNNQNQTVALTIIPQRGIPGQNVIVKLEDMRSSEQLALTDPRAAPAAGMPSQETEYVGYIRSLMAHAVRGQIRGFSVVPLETGVATIGDVRVEPDVVFSSATLDVYRYRLTNDGKAAIELEEAVFYQPGVKAVSFFPNYVLAHEESTFVFILADKSRSAGAAR